MNQRYTWALFLVFVALAAVALYVDRTDPEPMEIGEGPPTATPEPLIDLAPEALESVTAQTEDGSVTFTRSEDGWLVEEEPASDLVDSTLSALASPNVLRELPADRDPADYGFATLSMTVTMITEEGNEHVIEVGDDHAVDPSVYVRLRGSDRMVLISDSQISQLRDWVNDPPLAPTPTTEAEAEEADDDTVEDDQADEGEGEDADDATQDAGADESTPEGSEPDETPAPEEPAVTPGPETTEGTPDGETTDVPITPTDEPEDAP